MGHYSSAMGYESILITAHHEYLDDTQFLRRNECKTRELQNWTLSEYTVTLADTGTALWLGGCSSLACIFSL